MDIFGAIDDLTGGAASDLKESIEDAGNTAWDGIEGMGDLFSDSSNVGNTIADLLGLDPLESTPPAKADAPDPKTGEKSTAQKIAAPTTAGDSAMAYAILGGLLLFLYL